MKTMKTFTLLFCILFFTIIVTAQAPDLQGQKALGGTDNDFGTNMQQTADGGYIAAGITASFNGDVVGNNGDEDMWIVKLDKRGNIQWQNALGGFGDEGAFSIQQTRDGGYIAAGQANSFNGDVTGNHGNLDFWVVKLNANGNLVWQKSLGGSDADAATTIQQTRDGGYIVGGNTNSNDQQIVGSHGATDQWIVKLDASGNIQWSKTYGGSRNDFVYSIRQTSDGDYITAGNTNSNDGDITNVHDIVYGDFWITKLDRNGNLVWQKTYGGGDYEQANSIQLTSDGGYVAAGWSRSNNDGDVTGNHGNYDMWVIKISSTGNLQWQKSFGGSNGDLGYSVYVTKDNGYVIGGGTSSNNGNVTGNHGLEDFWIIKLNSTGNLQWQKTLGGSGFDEARSIVQTRDGGYASLGYTASNDGDVSGNHNPVYRDYWIIKLSSDAQSITATQNKSDALSAMSFTVSPNPASSFLNVHLPAKTTSLRIVNGAGTVVLEKNISKNKDEHNTQLDISKLASGLYYVHVKAGNDVIIKKFVKE